jgi:hypothetical protein
VNFLALFEKFALYIEVLGVIIIIVTLLAVSGEDKVRCD